MPFARLDGRHALVTGAGRGLGKACAVELAAAGAMVTLVARSEGELAEVAEEIEDAGGCARIHPADVVDAAAMEEAVAAAEAVAPLGILLTAAGLNRTGPTETYDLADFDLLMDVNVRGTFIACQAVGRRMLARGDGGRIVTMSSQMGSVGYPGRAAYCAGKHAVNGLTKALAVEWAPRGITVNAVAPTFVSTPMTEPMFKDPEFAAEVRRRIPGGEIASLDDVAAAVLYLVSDGARSVTGHVLAVDRGWTAW
ncbi:MAG TPA: SDR family NAD(P)-dependent oxidoreductase [Solirubrobacterales bacterium]|jgi:NAD(P)-dependent dehydrogenase (short-subunit alcohol dehydrogenase family)